VPDWQSQASVGSSGSPGKHTRGQDGHGGSQAWRREGEAMETAA